MIVISCISMLIVTDSASGSAILTELARVMATRKPVGTIAFVVAADDINILAQTISKTSINVDAMFINDVNELSISGGGSKNPFTGDFRSKQSFDKKRCQS